MSYLALYSFTLTQSLGRLYGLEVKARTSRSRLAWEVWGELTKQKAEQVA